MTMQSYSIEGVPITSLLINPDNPRFAKVSTQRDAINIMIKTYSKEVKNLGFDIIDYGINPSELLIVAPSIADKGFYIVLEGNRRTTALKLLHNPDLITDEKYKALKTKFKNMSKTFLQNPIERINCVVFLQPQDSMHWVKLRHTGQNSGIGLMPWNSQQVGRYDKDITGKPDAALQVIDFINKSPHIEDNLKSKLSKVPRTSLNRLLGDNNVRDLLGIDVIDGGLQTSLIEKELIKGLKKIIIDLLDETFTVRKIYTKKDREKYIETFTSRDIPKKSLQNATWKLQTPLNASLSTRSQHKRSNSISKNRHTIIPINCIIKIAPPKINMIYIELKSLDCDKYPNSAAVLLRVFIELSMDLFNKNKNIPNISIDSDLANKITQVTKYFIDKKILKKSELRGISAAGYQPGTFLAATFNSFVHNETYSPISTDIKILWDNLQTFIEKIWENI